jgi:FKBP-type peptidyl-prolyl cis-trans isomerase
MHHRRQSGSRRARRRRSRRHDRKKDGLPPQQRPQSTTLATGVQCQDLVTGGRGAFAEHRKKVRVSYTLLFKSHTYGKVLDLSGNFGFRLGGGEVIRGLDIGLRGIRVWGVCRLVVPPLAGYGSKDVGAGRGGDLYFQVAALYVAP